MNFKEFKFETDKLCICVYCIDLDNTFSFRLHSMFGCDIFAKIEFRSRFRLLLFIFPYELKYI